MQGLGKTKKDLKNLLQYTDELLSFNEKVIFNVSDEPYPQFYEHQVAGLEGVVVNVDGETWLSVQRLRETQPPEPDPIFSGWVESGPHPSPDHQPSLVSERMLRLSIEEISDLMEAGLVPGIDDVMRPVGSDDAFPDEMDVILRVENMPEFRSLWQEYLDGPWAQWAVVERPRRRSIDLYNKIYQIHQRMTALGDDTPMELVFGVGMARWNLKAGRINVPLIEQMVEIELAEDGTLLIRPRQMPPGLVLRAFHALEVEGSKGVQRDVAAQFDRTVEDPDVGFSPFDKTTFESILRACAARLSATGIYHPETLSNPDDRTLPAIDDTLRITDTWILYVRQRNENFRREDISRLIKRVEEAESEERLSAAGIRFVTEPSNEVSVEDDGTLIDLTDTTLTLPETVNGWQGGLGNGEATAEPKKAETYFFPLPCNEDQQEIIRRLEKSDGVVVQGPPGTGKTHTIANIICHHLATQRRVLVTAKTPEALTALREKIPEGIRDLAISVIHNDREGARQLEHAVRILADEAKAINPRIVDEQIREKQARLAELRDIIAGIDGDLLSVAQRNLARMQYGEDEVLPMQLAKKVAEERPLYGWFEDLLTPDPSYEPQFGDAEIAEIGDLRRRLAGDLTYDAETLPSLRKLPELPRVLAAHGQLVRINEIIGQANAGEIPFMTLESEVGLDGARETRKWLNDFAAFMSAIEGERWLLDVHQMLLGLKRLDDAATTALKGALDAWIDLHAEGRQFLLKMILIQKGPQSDPAFDKAIEDLASGKKPFGLFAMFKGGLKAEISAISIEGRPPSGPEDWAVVRDYRGWQQRVTLFLGRWTGVARAVGAPSLPTDWSAAQDDLFRLGRLIDQLCAFHVDLEDRRRALLSLFPYGIDLDDVFHHGRCAKAIEALAANLEKAELADAHAVRSEALAVAGDHALPFHTALREVCENLGNGEIPQTAIADAWQDILAEAKRLEGLRDDFVRLDRLVAKVAGSGAPKWARHLRLSAPSGETDPWMPNTWRKAWEWARADGYLRTTGDREYVRRLSEKRADAEAEQKVLFGEVVRLRTFLGLKRGLTQRIESALAKFAAAIARLGKGTGKTAGRQRRIIRDAALETAQAVPCWILPEWRVSEQLPAELAVFDLVVIDEASQSDIMALPAIMRGKKVLIVGDDKQVSPTVIGIEDRKVMQLRNTFLLGLPFADQMDPATSMYELGSMVFPGKAIMLREHFRCVEPIIRFSSRFYAKPLIPLRLPKASERLDPPLIDIYVPHGSAVRKTNEAEADVIVDEIRKLVADEAYRKRSIGVISLIGNVQAAKIYKRLVTELGAEIVEKHHIMCGDAATFQGQERDIVFLSMVACPKTAISQASRIYEQRFNVATSRARDRLVLVRSVASSHLKPGDLKLALIEHFRNPMDAGSVIRPKDVLDLCQSGFEEDFGRCTLDLGYRIRPQVPVGGYSIDFVIEGANDRRLAIELDGNEYHGPDKWADDIRRQKALERLGWVFWRCWGSTWIADREGCLADLKAALNRLGIEPLGMAPVDGVYTLYIEASRQDADDTTTNETRASTTSGTTDVASDEAFSDGLDVWTVAEVGDLVVLRYTDSPAHPLRIRLSDRENQPNEGIVHVSEPIGAAVLGAAVDDEVTVKIGPGTRTAVIEKIEKGLKPKVSHHRSVPGSTPQTRSQAACQRPDRTDDDPGGTLLHR